MFLLTLIFAAHSSNIYGVELFNSDSQPLGLSYDYWAKEWWQWIYLEPEGSNPASDTDGHLCSKNQRSDVWFLAGTFMNNSQVIRKCTIPFGIPILFPVIVGQCSIEENWLMSFLGNTKETLFSKCNATASEIDSRIDGKAIQPINHRSSEIFQLDFPNNNIKGIKPGTKASVSNGYWIMINSLPIGNHTVKSSATDTHGFISNVTYYLTVK